MSQRVQEEVLKAVESLKTISQLTTGPVKDDTPKIKPKPQRKIELFHGEPPQNADGKSMVVFSLKTEKCGIDYEREGDKYKCVQPILVQRVKNSKFERDSNFQGGQLVYDEKDIRQYKFCPEHGPFNVPESW